MTDQTSKPQRMNEPRVSKRLEASLRRIVEDGYSVKDAAESEGYRPQSLFLAMRRPHVKAFKRAIEAEIWHSLTDRARHRLRELLDSKDETIALRAVQAVLNRPGELQPAEGEGSGASERQSVKVYLIESPRKTRDISGATHQTIDVEAKEPAAFTDGDANGPVRVISHRP